MTQHIMESDKPKAPAKDAKAAKPKAKPYQRPRGGEARSISDLMPEIGRAAFRRFGFVQSSVVSRWPEIVGPRFADITQPESIRFIAGAKSEGVLHLVVSSGAGAMIQHAAPTIIERVNRFFGYNAVSGMKIRQGRIERHNPVPPRPAPPRALKPVPFELGDSLRDIGDPELAAVLESLARGLGVEDQGQAANGSAPVQLPLGKGSNIKPINLNGKIS